MLNIIFIFVLLAMFNLILTTMKQAIFLYAKLHLISFDIQTGVSIGYLFCPAYHVNTLVSLSYDQYHHVLGLMKYNFGRRINDNIFIIDRCFVNSILDNSF